jgi:hypothetical protein
MSVPIVNSPIPIATINAVMQKVKRSRLSLILAKPEKCSIKTMATIGKVEISADLNLWSHSKDIKS